MKPIKVMTTAALATLLLSVGAISAFAEEVGSYDTTGAVEFTASNEVTDPTDPTDPTKPVEPVDPGGEGPGPGTPGPLSIDFASSFYFGEQKISSQDADYYAAAQKVKTDDDGVYRDVPNYAQVTDNRGTEGGWTLSVTQNDNFISKKDASHTLEGAYIVISNIDIATASDSPKPSVVPTDITLDGKDTTAVIMGAAEGEGAGTYLAVFGNKDNDTMGNSVVLTVPGKITKYSEIYETSLTWSLSDTPANSSEENPDPEDPGDGDGGEEEGTI